MAEGEVDKIISNESSSSEDDDEEPYHDVNSCLPFRLEDLCLITIINELDSYPIELLAMLPCHLRYRLLSNIPNLDLNRLDHTPVAQGIDTEELWKTAIGSPLFNLMVSRRIDYDFVLATPFVTDDDLEPNIVAAMKEKSPKELYFLTLVWNILIDIGSMPPQPIIESYLDYHPENVYTEALDGLAAIRSHNFLVQLPGATKWKELPECRDSVKGRSDYDEYESATLDGYRRMWRKQATPLAKCKRYGMGIGYDTHVVLIPQRLLPIHRSSGPLEVLNHLVIGCGIQPLNLSIDADYLYRADSNLKTLYHADTADQSYHLFLKTFLSKVVILELTNIDTAHVDTLRYVFESVVRSGNDSSLKALELSSTSLDMSSLLMYLCTLPSDPPSLPHYQGLRVLKIGSPPEPSSLPYLTVLFEQQHLLNHVYIQLLDSCQDNHDEPELRPSAHETKLCDALSLLVSRKHFKSLTINFTCKRFSHSFSQESCCNLFPFTKLLHSFMVSPCAHKQSLHFENTNSSPPKELIPLVYSSSENTTTPDCGTEHKLLSYQLKDVKVIVPHLIQLPIIRLQDFVFNFEKGTESLFSQVAHHPNLNVTNLQINFGIKVINDPQEVQALFTTLCQDFERIFQMHTLKKFCLSGEWLCCSEIKKALVMGFKQQAQVCSLHKLHLEHQSITCGSDQPDIPYKYSESEVKELWSAIFTLPQVHQLEIELATEYILTLEFIDMVHIICDCWKQFSLEKKKLKSIQLSLHESGNFNEIWETSMLDPFKIVTHSLDIVVDYCRRSPELFSYF